MSALGRDSPPRDAAGRGLHHPRYWPYWALIGGLGLLYWMPRRWRDALGSVIGDWQYWRNAKRRGTVELNLRLCFPEWSEDRRTALAREHFRAYARAMLDQPVFWWDRAGRLPRELCRVRGIERIEGERAQGRSVILVEPHSAAVDIGGSGLTPRLTLSIMSNDMRSPVLDWVVNRARSRYGVEVFWRSQGLRPVVRALRRGTVFYYLPDEDFGDSNSVFAPFFGQYKATLTTVGRLAQRTGAAVIPVYAYYCPEERIYEMLVGEALRAFPSGDAVADATRINAAMESHIRQRPEAYLWGYRLFRHRPDGSLMRYPKHPKRVRKRRRRQRNKRKRASA